MNREIWTSGTVILVRNIWRDRVWEAVPVTVVQDDPARLVYYLPAGTPLRVTKIDHDTGCLDGPSASTWRGTDVLVICGIQDAYVIWAMWDATSKAFSCWYVNLQDKLRRVSDGIVTWDRSLDIQVTPDLKWNWKDEDHFARIQELQWISMSEAAFIRAEGERVIERIEQRQPPFSESWPEWTPDPNWAIPDMPDNWDELPQ